MRPIDIGMDSFAKEGQDRLAQRLIGEKGYFLDVGCDYPRQNNNTYLLERLGWTGILVDINGGRIRECKRERSSLSFQIDCAKFTRDEWVRLLESSHAPQIIDYMSVDVDGACSSFIKNFPFDRYEFKLMTYETDCYTAGVTRKNAAMTVLRQYPQYALLLENAQLDGGWVWEDWWVNEKYMDFKKYYAKNLYWLSFLKMLESSTPVWKMFL